MNKIHLYDISLEFLFITTNLYQSSGGKVIDRLFWLMAMTQEWSIYGWRMFYCCYFFLLIGKFFSKSCNNFHTKWNSKLSKIRLLGKANLWGVCETKNFIFTMRMSWSYHIMFLSICILFTVYIFPVYCKEKKKPKALIICIYNKLYITT